MTREQADEKARAAMATQTMEQLLLSWELTEAMPLSPEVAITRGWIMEEFERRDPAAFDRWMDNDYDQHPEKDTPRAWFAA